MSRRLAELKKPGFWITLVIMVGVAMLLRWLFVG
jgi:hypothetical protein